MLDWKEGFNTSDEGHDFYEVDTSKIQFIKWILIYESCLDQLLITQKNYDCTGIEVFQQVIYKKIDWIWV